MALTAEDLELLESTAPLLGPTPRRVKRFVSTCQLLLARPPRLRQDGGFPSERATVCFLAAINEGLPSIASDLFIVIGAVIGESLECIRDWELIDRGERDCLARWLSTRPEWKQVALTHLAVRVDFGSEDSFLSHD